MEDDDVIPYEYVLYRRGHDNIDPLELPHILEIFYEIIEQEDAEAAKIAAINAEIAVRYQAENDKTI